MTTIPRQQLKRQLEKYLEMVSGGEAVQVTDDGKPIACIFPIKSSTPHDIETLEHLVAKGGITLGAGGPFSNEPPAVLKPGKSIAEMVAEDRR